MFRVPRSAFFAAALAVTLALNAQTTPQRLDQILQGYFPADAPGAAIIVNVEGKPMLQKAYGKADLELNVPLKPDHVFRIGSLTKQFTAAAILKLVEDGKLTLDTKLSSILPGWPDTITIEHLLTHTSGIPSYTGFPDFRAHVREDIRPPDMLARIQKMPLEFAPGTQFRYSNSGYYVLGQVIEKVSGMPWSGFLVHFFIRLGMDHTAVDDPGKIISGRVPGYSRVGGKWVNAPFLSMTQPYSAGSLVSTVGDLAKWYDGLLAGDVVDRKLLKRAWTPYKSGYGYGWIAGEAWGNKTIEHGGGIDGFTSYAICVPAKRITVAVLMNSEPPLTDPNFVAAQALSFALGKPYDPKPIKVPAESLDAYAGTYKSADGAMRTICREGSQLVSQRLGPGGRRSVIQPMGKDRFFFTASLLQAQFERDKSGNVTAMTLERPNGPAERATRVSAGGCGGQ